MTTDQNETPGDPGPAKADAPEKSDKAPQKSAGDKKAVQPPPAGGAAKMSGAELKALKQAEKQARRAAAKDGKGGPPVVAAPQAGGGAAPQGAAPRDGKGKPDGAGAGSARATVGLTKGGSAGAHAGSAATAGAAREKELDPLSTFPAFFGHLPIARRLPMHLADRDTHPAILTLGQHMSTFAMTDSIERTLGMLAALKLVIKSYSTPAGTTLSRHFTPHVLNPQIEYLSACRPMSFAMGNAVRWLKLRVSQVDIDLPDEEAKELLLSHIDAFVSERVSVAGILAAAAATDCVSSSPAGGGSGGADVVLTYGAHRLVEATLAAAAARPGGRRFDVVVLDDPYVAGVGGGVGGAQAGLAMAKRLASLGGGGGIGRVTYCPDLSTLADEARRASCVLLGAEAVFGNGAVHARAGSADVAVMAGRAGVAVWALCETINFTERVATDSLTYNEIDPESNAEDGFGLLFDTTMPKYISKVVTEFGAVEAWAVPSLVQRKLEDQ